MVGVFQPIQIPEWAWRSEGAKSVLRTRDAAGILRLAQQYGGASQHRLANAVGILQGRVSEILKGSRHITSLQVFERIADGLDMPDHARITMGLAPRQTSVAGDESALFGEIIRTYPDQAAAAADIRAMAATASTVDVLAVRALGILGFKDSLLRPGVTDPGRPTTTRVLLVHPDSPAAGQRATEISESAESFASGIQLSLARLRELAAAVPLEVYLYDALPVWRMIGIDDTLFMSAFAAEWEGHESPTYKIVSTEGGAFYRGFRRMFEDLRNGAERVI
jgi:transcriptional regulator with XRE-family HTH domain